MRDNILQKGVYLTIPTMQDFKHPKFLSKYLDAYLDQDFQTVIIDLRLIDYVHSMHLGILSYTHKSYEAIGRHLIVVTTNKVVLEVIRITGLKSFLNVCSSLESAKEILDGF